jgi:hypothetical protein
MGEDRRRPACDAARFDFQSVPMVKKQLNFDEPVDAEPLPSFSEFVKTGGAKGEPMGKKKARQQERRAVAVAASEVEKEDGSQVSISV